MKKGIILIIFFVIFVFYNLYGDFIIPLDDTIYDYLESMEILGVIPSTVIYPEYYDNVISNMSDSSVNEDISQMYRLLNDKFLSFIKLNGNNGLNSDAFPLSELPKKILQFRNINQPRTAFVEYKNGDINLFSSFILGIDYDLKNKSNECRTYQYYGLEFGGNIQKNLGFYTRYRKGNYKGDYDFIHEDPYIHFSGEKDRKVTVSSEFDFKNPILNLSVGYSNFRFGKTITSSVILNGMTNPFGYMKYYKKIGSFNFIAFNSQLTTDSVTVSSEFPVKSFSLQSLNYQTDRLLFGIGQSVIYGNKTIDFAYWTPLMVFKLIDFKNHNRDNEFVFAYSTWRPVDGCLHYFNFFMDDLKKSQLFTKDWLTNFALQTGAMFQIPRFPLRVSAECTIVGPVTYTHREYELIYSHDNMLLGYLYGSNLVNLAFQINYMNPYFSIVTQYENMQQGSYGGNPFNCETVPAEFLSGRLSRTQRLMIKFRFYLNRNLRMKIQYKLIQEKNTESYLSTGIELQL